MSADKDKIADLAYRIWEEEGRPEGRDLDHWLKAEATVASAKKPKAPKAAAKPKAEAKAKPAAKPKAAKAPAKAKAKVLETAKA